MSRPRLGGRGRTLAGRTVNYRLFEMMSPKNKILFFLQILEPVYGVIREKDLKEFMKAYKIEDEVLKKLLREGLIYQPTPVLYKRTP